MLGIQVIVMAIVAASAPLYVFFGWLSDKTGRKPVMLAGMSLALIFFLSAEDGAGAFSTSGKE